MQCTVFPFFSFLFRTWLILTDFNRHVCTTAQSERRSATCCIPFMQIRSKVWLFHVKSNSVKCLVFQWDANPSSRKRVRADKKNLGEPGHTHEIRPEPSTISSNHFKSTIASVIFCHLLSPQCFVFFALAWCILKHFEAWPKRQSFIWPRATQATVSQALFDRLQLLMLRTILQSPGKGGEQRQQGGFCWIVPEGEYLFIFNL